MSIDEKLLRQARIKALKQGRSLNGVLRSYLESYVAGDEPDHVLATRAFLKIARKAEGHSGGARWSREELHERR
ncbi:MAG: hypothetical protein AB1651_17260 [Pseudomonadota bacterium]